MRDCLHSRRIMVGFLAYFLPNRLQITFSYMVRPSSPRPLPLLGAGLSHPHALLQCSEFNIFETETENLAVRTPIWTMDWPTLAFLDPPVLLLT